MFSAEISTQIKKMFTGVFLLGIIMVGGFALAGWFSLSAVWGAALGCSIAVLNYILLAMTIDQALGKGGNGAASFMAISYSLRMVLIAVGVIVAIRVSWFNYFAAIIPLLFPRIIIFVLEFRGKKSEV